MRNRIRIGKTFRTFAGPPAEVTHICRIYISPARGASHFFGCGTKERNDTMEAHPDFVLEDVKFMAIRLPNARGCPLGLTPVYRVFSNRADANHRCLTDKVTRAAMVAKGWLAEDDGPDLIVSSIARKPMSPFRLLRAPDHLTDDCAKLVGDLVLENTL